MHPQRVAAVLAFVIFSVSACGGGNSPGANKARQTSDVVTTTTVKKVTAGRSARLGGEKSLVTASTDGEGDVSAHAGGRRCAVDDAPLVDCHAGTGAGGPFVVTVEGGASAPLEWRVVVRCGLDPAVPVASARGSFTPQLTELGLKTYGEIVGVTLNGDQEGDASLAFLPSGAECPVIWGLGPIKRFSSFTGGLDPLNGSERPLQFTRPDGTVACVVADSAGGLDVHAASAGGCGAAA
jgi:hypothetical protein